MDIQKSIVAILGRKKTIIGTGFVVGDNLILTCAHVVETVTSTAVGPDIHLNLQVTVRFAVDGSEAIAQVDLQNCSPAHEKDVALLRVDVLPQGVKPLPLAPTAGSAGHDFYAYGYATVMGVQGIGSRGKIVDIVDNGRLVQLTSQEPDHGMSGGPVLDEQRHVVIGMVTKGKGLLEKDQNLRNTQTTFATSVEVISKVCSNLPVATKPKRAKRSDSKNRHLVITCDGSDVFLNSYPTRESGDKSQLAHLYDIPDWREQYLHRDDYFTPVKKLILSKENKIVALHGMSGVGKSVLATKLAYDDAIRREFPDGVIWITLGKECNITARQSQIAENLGEKVRYFEDPQRGKAVLRGLFEKKSCFLILDDVWSIADVAAFNCAGVKGKILVTTQVATIPASLDAETYTVNSPDEKNALDFLASWSGQPVKSLPREAGVIIRKCGALPLALATIGALAKRDPANWQHSLYRLQNADLKKIGYQFPDYQHENLMYAIQASTDALVENVRDRYLDFAVFPEDTPIPQKVLAKFWSPLGLEEPDVKDIIDVLIDHCLVFRNSDNSFSLHDLQFAFVRNRATNLTEVRKRLDDVYSKEVESAKKVICHYRFALRENPFDNDLAKKIDGEWPEIMKFVLDELVCIVNPQEMKILSNELSKVYFKFYALNRVSIDKRIRYHFSESVVNLIRALDDLYLCLDSFRKN